MRSFSDLEAEFAQFDGLPFGDEKSDPRKDMVREVQTAIRGRSLAMTDEEFRRCRDGDAALGRIAAYLYAENKRVDTQLADWRIHVSAEWERLQHVGLGPGTSFMPLYYATRCYLTLLKGAPDSAASARVDRALFEQISKSLEQKGSGHQIRNAIAEITSVIDKATNEESHPTIIAARITSNRTVVAAVIAGLVAISVGILTNWDKLPRWTSRTPSADDKSTPLGSLEQLRKEYCELLRPLEVELDRTKAAFDGWNGKDLSRESETIRDGNRKALDLLREKAHLVPDSLREDQKKLILHYDQWLQEYDRVRIRRTKPEQAFVFVYSFPDESAQRFRDRIAQVEARLGRERRCG